MKNGYILVLCGPSGSGKSTLARRLKRLGWVHLDGDDIARSLYVPGSPLLKRVARAFEGVLQLDGNLDRAALGAKVFGKPGARRRLSALVYPALLRSLRARLRTLRARNAHVVLDMAVYLDAGAPRLGDAVALVDAPRATRERRLRVRGLSPARARAQAGALHVTRAQAAHADLKLDAGRTPALVWRELKAFLKEHGAI